MITSDDILQYINTAGADFSSVDFDTAIAIAYQRFKEITETEVVDDTDPINRKSLILLAISELSTQINLYWRGKENTEIIRTRDVVAEVEKLLKPKQKTAMRFMKL
jgi:hypothetical protein